MKVIRIIGIHNKDNEFPNVAIVSIYESFVTWQLLHTRFKVTCIKMASGEKV